MKQLIILTTILFSITSFGKVQPKKILMMVSEGFYAPEYYIPYEIFKKAGFIIETATKYKRETKPDERQLKKYKSIIGDLSFKEVNPKDYDAVVFAGGNGAWEDFFPNKNVHDILNSFMNTEKTVGLLCSSVGLLGVANNLDGKGTPIALGRKVTGYKRVEGLLVNLGKVNFSKGNMKKPYVVVDGNLITGRDPMSAELFANKITAKLINEN